MNEENKRNSWCVYVHTAPNGKVYVGITSQRPKLRWQNGKGYKTNKHFTSAINKYGWDNFTHEVIADGYTQEQAEQKERELITLYNSANKLYGYNRALGGHALSAESRKKISDTRKERITLGLIETKCGRHLSKETKKKISESQKGKPGRAWTDEQKEKLRKSKTGAGNANFGKPMSEACKLALLAANEKPVYQLDGDIKVKYRSAKAAGEATGICISNITRCCREQRGTAGGFRWCYA